jgi:hypothetical protein
MGGSSESPSPHGSALIGAPTAFRPHRRQRCMEGSLSQRCIVSRHPERLRAGNVGSAKQPATIPNLPVCLTLNQHGLALIGAVIALWNTLYLDRAPDAPSQQREVVPETLRGHLAPGRVGGTSTQPAIISGVPTRASPRTGIGDCVAPSRRSLRRQMFPVFPASGVPPHALYRVALIGVHSGRLRLR